LVKRSKNLIKHRKFGQKSKISSKIESFGNNVINQNIGQRSKFWLSNAENDFEHLFKTVVLKIRPNVEKSFIENNFYWKIWVRLIINLG